MVQYIKALNKFPEEKKKKKEETQLVEDFLNLSIDENQDKFVKLLHKTIQKKKKFNGKYYVTPTQLKLE